jgi:hypothetical protein
MDALNFATQLGFVKKASNLDIMEAGVARFVLACRNAGWEPTIFIETGIESGEALTKWEVWTKAGLSSLRLRFSTRFEDQDKGRHNHTSGKLSN